MTEKVLSLLDEIERQAFLIPPPNPFTPIIVQGVIEARQAIRQHTASEAKPPVSLEKCAEAACQDIKRQFGGHPIPGVPPQVDSWTATGGVLECSELAKAVLEAAGVKYE